MKTLAAIILVLSSALSEVEAQVAVVAHQSVPADTLSSERLLDLYTGDSRTWDGGMPVILFDLKVRDEIKRSFYKFLGKSPSRMKSIWLKRLLSGEGDPPEAFETQEALLEKIAATPGALGYVHLDKVGQSVKIIAIIDLDAD